MLMSFALHQDSTVPISNRIQNLQVSWSVRRTRVIGLPPLNSVVLKGIHIPCSTESFDPFHSNPQWVPVDSPCTCERSRCMGVWCYHVKILAMDDRGGVAYDPNQDTGSSAE